MKSFVLAVALMLASTLASAQLHLGRVGYVMLGTSDLDRATQFYADTLRLKVTSRAGDLLIIDGGSISIVLSTEVGKDSGSMEVVFAVDHVEAAYQALRQAGIPFQHGPHAVTPQSWAANFHDPDGHNLSIFGPR